MSKLTDITKKTDNHAYNSEANLKAFIESKIKKVYVNALRCIEMRFGESFDGYDQIRREILRVGNDAVREVNETIEESFNVEEIPNVLTVKFNNSNTRS